MLPLTNKIPTHVAIIMDGNGRWAAKRGLMRLEGHRRGSEVVENLVIHAKNLGVRYLTLYAFSQENWQRPSEEVEALMSLLVYFLQEKKHRLIQEGIALQCVGEISYLPSEVQQVLHETMDETRFGDKLRLNLALSYSSRFEILKAAQSLFELRLRNQNLHEPLTEKELETFFYQSDLPDPDLLIRTSGEHRISNFLLWQLAYTELYFTQTLWPDFSCEEFDKALAAYASRERRFGLTSEQLQSLQTPE